MNNLKNGIVGSDWLLRSIARKDAEDWFFGTITIRKINRNINGSSSPFALWASVEMSNCDIGPLLHSKSIIPHHVFGEIKRRPFSRATGSNEEDGCRRTSSWSRGWHSDETNASPSWHGTNDCIRIVSLVSRQALNSFVVSIFRNVVNCDGCVRSKVWRNV